MFCLIFTVFSSQKAHKNCPVPSNGCDSLQIFLFPLDSILRFPKKLLVKLCFGNFQMFLGICSLFIIFAPQKPPQNHHRSLK